MMTMMAKNMVMVMVWPIRKVHWSSWFMAMGIVIPVSLPPWKNGLLSCKPPFIIDRFPALSMRWRHWGLPNYAWQHHLEPQWGIYMVHTIILPCIQHITWIYREAVYTWYVSPIYYGCYWNFIFMYLFVFQCCKPMPWSRLSLGQPNQTRMSRAEWARLAKKQTFHIVLPSGSKEAPSGEAAQ